MSNAALEQMLGVDAGQLGNKGIGPVLGNSLEAVALGLSWALNRNQGSDKSEKETLTGTSECTGSRGADGSRGGPLTTDLST